MTIESSWQPCPDLGDERLFTLFEIELFTRDSVMAQMLTDVSKTQSHLNILFLLNPLQRFPRLIRHHFGLG